MKIYSSLWIDLIYNQTYHSSWWRSAPSQIITDWHGHDRITSSLLMDINWSSTAGGRDANTSDHMKQSLSETHVEQVLFNTSTNSDKEKKPPYHENTSFDSGRDVMLLMFSSTFADLSEPGTGWRVGRVSSLSLHSQNIVYRLSTMCALLCRQAEATGL